MKENQNPTDKDSQALWATRNGNTQAFSGIVERYQNSLLRLGCSFLGDKEEAREAVQDVFLKVYKARHFFDYERPFKPWLYSIAINHLKSCYKANSRKKEREVTATSQFLIDNLEDPLELLIEYDLRIRIRTAILNLPSRLQNCTILYYLEEMEVNEICELLDIGRENVKSRLFRARKILKGMLTNYWVD